jgi:hypothetical protein
LLLLLLMMLLLLLLLLVMLLLLLLLLLMMMLLLLVFVMLQLPLVFTQISVRFWQPMLHLQFLSPSVLMCAGISLLLPCRST